MVASSRGQEIRVFGIRVEGRDLGIRFSSEKEADWSVRWLDAQGYQKVEVFTRVSKREFAYLASAE